MYSPARVASPPAAQRGSISAEHGLGFKKAQYIHYSKPPEAVRLMKEIKRIFDPKVRGAGQWHSSFETLSGIFKCPNYSRAVQFSLFGS